MKTSLALALFWFAGLTGAANAADAPGPEQSDAHFSQTAPYSDATNITRHFGYTVELPAYNITNETFQIIIPAEYSTNATWGLLVWISPSEDPAIPQDWKEELKKQKLLFVSARHSGNGRHPLDRFRMALDGTCNICRRYQIDRKRIYIGGFSGGARMASMLGVAYGDVFTGTLCFCGVNFYKDIAASEGKYYPATFVPDPGALLLSKRTGRFVLLTGEFDENRQNTKSLYVSGFKREGFRNVLYLEIPGMSHAMPDASILRRSLDYLAGKTE